MVGFMTDENGDILIENGHMAIGDNKETLAAMLIASNRGDFKEFPMLGCEAQKLMGGTETKLWTARAKKQLETAGILVNNIKVVNGQIYVEL